MTSVLAKGKWWLVAAIFLIAAIWISNRVGIFNDFNPANAANADRNFFENSEKKKSQSKKSRAQLNIHTEDPRLNRLFNPVLGQVSSEISSEQIEKYLKAAGRTERTFSIAFLLSRDMRLLDELANYPDSKLAQLMIVRGGNDPAKVKQAALQLIKLDPTNPQGFYWSANCLIKEGKTDEAMKYLKEAAALPGEFDIIDTEIRKNMVGALNLMGYSGIEAPIYLMREPQWYQDYLTTTRNVSGAISKSMEGLSDSERAENAGTLIGIFRRQGALAGGQPPQTLMTEMANERDVLKVLPQDIEYGDNSTVAERVKELRNTLADETQLMASEALALKKAKPEKVDKYFEIYETTGYRAARDWLLNEK